MRAAEEIYGVVTGELGNLWTIGDEEKLEIEAGRGWFERKSRITVKKGKRSRKQMKKRLARLERE